MLQTETIPDGQVFTKIANLKGVVVAVKKMQIQKIEITRKILLELKQARVSSAFRFYCKFMEKFVSKGFNLQIVF